MTPGPGIEPGSQWWEAGGLMYCAIPAPQRAHTNACVLRYVLLSFCIQLQVKHYVYFSANGKNSTSAVCCFAFARGNE